jgi:hypothetical protein
MTEPNDPSPDLAPTKVAVVTVVRTNGLSGKVSCNFETVDGTAVAASDFVAQSGELVFEPGVTQRQIQVEIVDDGAYEKDEDFRLEISDVQVN